MDILRKIGSGIVFVLAILGALATLAGVFGVWWARNWADQTVGETVALLVEFVNVGGQSVADLDQRLAETEQTVANVQTRVARLSDGQTDPEEEAFRRTVIEDLQPRVERLRESAVGLSAALTAIDQTVKQLNRMPFVNLPTHDANLAALQSTVAETAVRTRELAEAVRSLDGSRILAATEEVSTRLSDARAALARVQSFAESTRVALGELRATLSVWLTIGAAVITPLLLLFLAGQVSLAFHAWGWIRAKRQSTPQVVRV